MSYLWILLFASLAIGATEQGFDLADALDDKPTKAPAPKAPDNGGFDLADALGPDDPPKPNKPAVKPPQGGGTGGGTFGDSDLHDLVGGGGDYHPDKGGGPIHHPDYDGGKDDGHKDSGSSKMTTILSSVGVAVVGAIASYFAYKKRQHCSPGNQRNSGLHIGGRRDQYGPGNNPGGRGMGGGGGFGGAGGGFGGAGGVLNNLLRMV